MPLFKKIEEPVANAAEPRAGLVRLPTNVAYEPKTHGPSNGAPWVVLIGTPLPGDDEHAMYVQQDSTRMGFDDPDVIQVIKYLAMPRQRHTAEAELAEAGLPDPASALDAMIAEGSIAQFGLPQDNLEALSAKPFRFLTWAEPVGWPQEVNGRAMVVAAEGGPNKMVWVPSYDALRSPTPLSEAVVASADFFAESPDEVASAVLDEVIELMIAGYGFIYVEGS